MPDLALNACSGRTDDKGVNSRRRARVRSLRPIAATIILALPLIALSAPPAAQGATRVTKATLAPGVNYSTFSIAGPNRIKIVTIDPSTAATIDVAVARNTLPGFSRTSSMAQAHNALAAINGDFGLSPGVPGHGLAEDGSLLQTSPLGAEGKNFAIRANESKSFIGGPEISVDVHRVTPNSHLFLDHWNEGDPRNSEVNGYTAFGGNVENPPSGSCSVRLLPSAQPGWASSQAGVLRSYTVDALACGSSPLSLGSGPGAVVIATQTGSNRANDLRAFVRGETVRLTWSFGWPGILDAIGGSPVLLEDGRVVVDPCGSYLCQRHPRTAVGIKANGVVMFFQVDGRSSASIGLTLVGLAKEMQRRGAVWAMNLDGGGSSTMWVRGRGVVNNPSDGTERSVTTALLVLPGKDSGEPLSLASREPVESGGASASFEAAIHDPASTGGLLDAIANGDIPGEHVPEGSRAELASFRNGV